MNKARGFRSRLGLPNGPFPVSRDYFEEDERCGSTVRDWVGIEIEPIIDLDGTVDVRGHVGCFLADQTPSSLGGAPLNNPRFAALQYGGVAVESFASLVTRNHVVVGDGRANPDEGWDTDVLHVNGGLRVGAFVEAPRPGLNLPDSQLAGFMYFDLTRNCLRIATPFVINKGTPEEQKGLAWQDLAFIEPKKGDLAKNLVRPDETITDMDELTEMKKGKVKDAFEGATLAAADGTLTAITPRMEAITINGEIPSGSDVILLFNPISQRHFDPGKYTFSWQRLAGAKNGPYTNGGIAWTPIERGDVEVEFIIDRPDGGEERIIPQVRISNIDFAQPAADGTTGEGMIIQIMAVTALNDVCSASFRIM